MSGLAEFQAQFQEAVFDPSPGAKVSSWVEDDGLTEERLNVYRNNVFYSLTDSLAAVYPVIFKLVGEDFFRGTAAEFIRQAPPKMARILEYGAEFSDFLTDFEPAKPLRYLPDIARLEWAWNEAYNGADRAPLPPEKLQSFPPDRMAEICFTLHPTSRLIESAYPIDAIWSANQEGADEQEVDLGQGKVFLQVIRPDQDVEVRQLTQGAFMFLQACEEGVNLGAAYESAVAMEPELDLTQLLSDFLLGNTFTEATLHD